MGTEIADRYRRVAAEFTSTVESVPERAWSNPSPCAGWTARDVVAHVAADYFPRIGKPAPGGTPAEDDPVAAWAAARDAVQAALDDPAVAATEYDGVLGRTRFEAGIDALLCFDLVVHRWDVARAAGLDERLDPDDVRRLFDQVRPMDEALRTPGVCGPKIEPVPEADEQTQLLAFLGRTP